MDEPNKQLTDLYILNQPPASDELATLVAGLERWADRYATWHRDFMQSVAKALLAQHRQLLDRVSKLDEAEAIATLTSDDDPTPMVVANDGTHRDATPFYEAMGELRDAAIIVEKATATFLDAFKAVDRMLGDAEPDDAKDKRPLRLLAESLVSILLPFSSEVERLKEGTGLIMARIGRHPEEPNGLEEQLASHVVILARAGHSDGAIARILSESCPSWTASALTRVRAELGDASAPRVEQRRLQELLKERVRKMRADRGVAAGREVKAGKVDPLRGLAEIAERSPEADDESPAPVEPTNASRSPG